MKRPTFLLASVCLFAAVLSGQHNDSALASQQRLGDDRAPEILSLRSQAASARPLWLASAPVLAVREEALRHTAEGAIRALPSPDLSRMVFHSTESGSVLVFRIEEPGAAALRLHFEDVHLPEGASLFVYGVKHGEAVGMAGPYTGSGPTRTGEFWADAVPGSVAVVELHMIEEEGSLPFRIPEIASLDAMPAIETSAPRTAPVIERRTSLYRGMPVEHEVIDGYAVWEGDILLGRAEEMEPYRGQAISDKDQARLSLTTTGSRWPGGVVAYTIDPTMPSQNRVTDAVNHWNTNLAGYIRLVPRTSESTYLYFVRPASSGTCSSYVGYTGMAGQPVNIGDSCSTGNTIHEIGHALGLYHEHTRPDRDTYVIVYTQNITSSALGNFSIVNGNKVGSYDYGSIMHYPAYAFSSNGQATIVTIPAGIPIGQRSGLSAGDVNGIKAIYPPSTGGGTGSSVTVSFTSSPTGAALVIDGQTLVTPASVVWAVGSSHTIFAPNSSTTTRRLIFTSWSNGGAQTQTITAPASASTYSANFRTQFRVTAVPSDATKGTVSRSPVTVDDFYDLNSTVALSALAGPGNCFVSWSGITPVSNFSTSVTVNQAYSVVGNLQTGAVTFPTSLNVPQAGGRVSLSISATSGCLWRASSQASWIKLGTATGNASAALSLDVSRNNTKSARSGYVNINGVNVLVTQAGR